jgi:hypothetical protein
MSKAFESWTVLPHKPIEKLADNLWRVSGSMPNGRVQRQMVLARLADKRILVHNAVALGDAEMAEIEAWGEPAILFVPNGYHRQDAAIWKKRYPGMTVVTPAGSRKRVEKVVKVDKTSEQISLDDSVSLTPIDGIPAESLLQVKSGDEVSLIVCDALFNMPKLGGAKNLFMGPTGKVAVSRIVRWFLVKDKRAYAAALQRMAATPGLRRVLVGHGRPVVDDPATRLRAAATQLS